MITKGVQAQNNTPPTISILSPTNDTVFDVGARQLVFFQLNYQSNGTVSWVGYSIDGASNITVNGTGEYVDDAESSGYHNLTLYANDTTGNWATPQTVTWLTKIHGDVGAPFPFMLLLIPVTLVIIVIMALLLFRRHRKNKSTKPTSP
ncbi:MAG: hypothetical protein NWE93_08270 [Candidatus Bathyarchaeota archaeon]|nr:hypothetical protein [Candidatus Bathyarchaeota archaeon]